MTPVQLAAALRMIARAHPCWAEVVDEACAVLESLDDGDGRAAPTTATTKRAYWREKKRAQRAGTRGDIGGQTGDKVGHVPDKRGERGELVLVPCGVPCSETRKDTTSASLSLHPVPETAGTFGGHVQLVQPDTTVFPSSGWTPGFKRFFDAYPQHRRDMGCIHAWKRLELEAQADRVVAGVELWKMCGEWQTPRYVPKMREFLERGQWANEPPKDKPKAGPVGGTLDKWAGVKGGAVNG